MSSGGHSSFEPNSSIETENARKRQVPPLLLALAAKTTAVILQEKDHETNALHPSYMVKTLGWKKSRPSTAYHIAVPSTTTWASVKAYTNVYICCAFACIHIYRYIEGLKGTFVVIHVVWG